MPRRKKVKIPPETFMGYEIGQEVYCMALSDDKLCYGPITEFHKGCSHPEFDEPQPAVTVACLMRGSFQTCYMMDIISDPTKKQVHKAQEEMAKLGMSLSQRKKRS